jgi:hypothetical protein
MGNFNVLQHLLTRNVEMWVPIFQGITVSMG